MDASLPANSGAGPRPTSPDVLLTAPQALRRPRALSQAFLCILLPLRGVWPHLEMVLVLTSRRRCRRLEAHGGASVSMHTRPSTWGSPGLRAPLPRSLVGTDPSLLKGGQIREETSLGPRRPWSETRGLSHQTQHSYKPSPRAAVLPQKTGRTHRPLAEGREERSHCAWRDRASRTHVFKALLIRFGSNTLPESSEAGKSRVMSLCPWKARAVPPTRPQRSL